MSQIIPNGDNSIRGISKSNWGQYFSLNREMVATKVTYFLYGSMTASNSYINIFFISIGLTVSQAGFISGLSFATSTIVGPLWGALADYTGRRRLILVFLCVGGALMISPLPWIASAFTHKSVNRTCYMQENIFSNNQCIHSKIEDTNLVFYVVVVTMLVGSAFCHPLPGYIDSIIVNVVKTSNTKASYGAQRVFDFLGYSAATYVAGLASDHYDHPGMSRYTPVFCMFLCSTLLILPMGCHLLRSANFEERRANINKNSSSIGMGKQLWNTIREYDVILFVITVFISGIAMSVFVHFVLLLVNDEMETTRANMSLVLVIASISNAVISPFASKIIKFLGGPPQAIAVGIFSYFIRFYAMSYTTVLVVVALMQAFNGFSFALVWISMMEYLYIVTPPDINFTVFLILNSLHFGFCPLITNMIGGYVYQEFGGKILFRGIGFICGMWSACSIIYYATKYFRKKYSADGCEKKIKTASNVEVGDARRYGYSLLSLNRISSKI